MKRTISSILLLIGFTCWGACRDELLPKMAPVIAKKREKPFDDPRYLFEMKYDGFRGLTYFERDYDCHIVSRQGNKMTQFQDLCEAMAKELKVESVIFDGEVIAVDETGRPIFKQMLRRQGPFRYVAFDLLWVNGEDLRSLPLETRRERLAKVLPKGSKIIQQALGEVGNGIKMFDLMMANDLEGIVAKRLDSKYTRSADWYKIKNPHYSQNVGRARFFRK